MWLARHLDKIGIGGALFAALCCLGFPALLAVVSAVGLAFLINDAALIPLLAAFLVVALVASRWARAITAVRGRSSSGR